LERRLEAGLKSVSAIRIRVKGFFVEKIEKVLLSSDLNSDDMGAVVHAARYSTETNPTPEFANRPMPN
jgi:hypothetical protein